ncbi:MAG: N-acetylmuramoyl-L-alanine amidase family protein [Clostridiales bacterium]|jgi:N-acetylmuramoyl-L-alanine amidase|nr:N-acetylmuramoyl-L-alanine amidase family protein [Clostridiales bacterium]
MNAHKFAKNAAALSLCVLISAPAPVFAAAPDMRLIVNGEEITDPTAPPVIYDDYALVPARGVFEKLNAIVSWRADDRSVDISYGAVNITLRIDDYEALVDGKPERIDVAPKIINDKTMIPLRFISESLGFEVGWDPDARTASVVGPPVERLSDQRHLEERLSPSLDMAALHKISEGLETDDGADESTPSGNSGVITIKDVSTDALIKTSAPQTKIMDITPSSGDKPYFSIVAESEISEVDKFSLDGDRLVLDIYGALNALPKNEYVFGNDGVLKARASQNRTEPSLVTRVVFEMDQNAEFSVAFSEDRKAINVHLEQNEILNYSLETGEGKDVLSVRFRNDANADVYLDGGKLLVRAPNSSFADGLSTDDSPTGGSLVKAIKAARDDKSAASLELSLNERVSYSVSADGPLMVVVITKPTYRNIEYDDKSHVLRIAKTGGLTAINAKETDLYSKLEYVIQFAGSYGAEIGYGEMPVRDGFVNSVKICDNDAGFTEIIISEARILAYEVSEDNEYVYARAVTPVEKYKRVVTVDPGHGGRDPGASANGLLEKDLCLSVAKKTAEALEARGVKTYLTREDDSYPSLSARAALANDVGGMFVSIHINSADKNPNANGLETFFYPNDFDGSSGVSGEKLANIIHKELLAATGLKDRTVFKNELYVLKNSKLPSAFVELGFISAPDEAAKISSPAFQLKAAEAIADGAVKAFGVKESN